MKDVYPSAHPKALRILEKMLRLKPLDRLKAEDGLRDPYLSSYHNADDEPVCSSAYNFDFDEQVCRLILHFSFSLIEIVH